ncbi:competence protein ComEA [Bacilli bacterium PM5-3]|nr:competence protein ComEA [Bacilli bacterium PM5-3]MDH6603493.1 competence protein ComEA [Bacilli bacterium PM5-9]
MKKLLLVFFICLSGCYDNLTLNQITFNTTIKYKITIEGHINKPGLYLVNDSTSISQLIKLAGGYKNNALKVNNDIILRDNLKIFINSNRIETKINLNNCSTKQLETIKGIGPSLSQKIIEYRKKYGEFEIISDLLNVKGIKEKKFNKIYEYLTIE